MEAPTRASQLRCWSPLWTSLAALGLFTVPLACISSIALNDQVFQLRAIPVRTGTGAAAGGRRHLGMAAPGNRLGKVARVVILAGLALLALGNAVEAIGIWGWSWNGSGRYLATNQSLVQTHELGRLGSALRELSVVAGSC